MASEAAEIENEVLAKARKEPGFVDFVHLHNHTHYSLLDGLQKVPQLVDRVESIGQASVAITDHGTLSGSIEFYKACKSKGIRPIIGLETYVAPRKHTDKNSAEDRNPYHLTLLAKNNQGYQNLMKLSTIACLEGFYYKPRIDHELIEKYSEGIIALSGCLGGELGTLISNDQMEQALELAKWYLGIFGKDNYYLELQPHVDWAPQKKLNAGLMEISKKLGIDMVVTGDCHYSTEADHYPHDILLCVQTGSNIDDENRMKLEMDLSVQPGSYFLERFPDHPEVLSNTVKIAEMCDVNIELGKILIPRFPGVPEGETEKSYLRKLVYQGAADRYTDMATDKPEELTEDNVKPKLDKKVLDRIEYELKVIGEMGYEGYMLIVSDLINWSKSQGIVCGPGRGSAAGSIIAYCTKITELDPIRYELLFERFLNPDRISMPDIDMDYADDRREEVIAYATDKYGQERVAQIITFGVMAARNAVRDTGRVLGVPYGEVDAIAKVVPPPVQGRHIPLKVSLEESPELKAAYNASPKNKEIIDIAIQLEGTIRNAGTHAAGVVIAPEPLVEYTPLTRASKGGIATQYSMNPIEELGLLKFDFLGLSNLTVIKNAIRIIKKVYKKEIVITEIPIDDKKTFELLSNGDTTGVFQLESAGMKRYLRELKPDKFEDIIAMVSLYRPGPMQWIEDFINRKHRPELVTYGHPKMEAALKETYGIIVYQEQVMQIAKDLSGFTGGQADTLRKGIGKKIPEVIAKMKNEFIDGAIKTSDADKKFVEDLWKGLEDFAAYSFNKSHAACYALISVQTAYLKSHYPSAFMAALLTSDHENLDRIAIEVAECRKMGIEVLPPEINESFMEFAVVPETGNIRFGLGAVKNVGQGPIEKIIEARDADGPFKSVEDFAQRVDAAVVNKKVMESLIKCGAFDAMGDRDTMLFNVDKITSYASRVQKNALSGQIDIFGSLNLHEEIPPISMDKPNYKIDPRQHLMWEKELLGLYVSTHPLDDFKNYLLQKTNSLKSFTKADDGKAITIGGIVTSARKIYTKKNDPMAFAQLETLDGDVELIVFPRVYAKIEEILLADNVLEIEGKINAKDRDGNSTDELKIFVDKAKVLNADTARMWLKPPDKPQKSEKDQKSALTISLKSIADTDLLMKIKGILDNNKGDSPVTLLFTSTNQKMRLPGGIDLSEDLLNQIKDVTGVEDISTKQLEAAPK
jgi:DNA polymerase-3 subunit alpha